MDLVLDLTTTNAYNKSSPSSRGRRIRPAVVLGEHSQLVCAAERIVHRNADYIGLLQRQGISLWCVLCNRNVTQPACFYK